MQASQYSWHFEDQSHHVSLPGVLWQWLEIRDRNRQSAIMNWRIMLSTDIETHPNRVTKFRVIRAIEFLPC